MKEEEKEKEQKRKESASLHHYEKKDSDSILIKICLVYGPEVLWHAVATDLTSLKAGANGCRFAFYYRRHETRFHDAYSLLDR